MDNTNSAESPLETVGERTIEAFELLADETRMAILVALWESIDPGPPPFEPAVSFSELRKRVGMRHGEQFNYHLDKLVGQFVRKTDAGYSLTNSAERILSTVLAGTLADTPSFADERIDAACMLCGAPTIVDYRDGVLTQRCLSCDGVTSEPTEPPGAIAKEYRPPVGLENRTPQAFVQQGKTWQRHRRHAFIEKTCPDCSGTITTTIEVCDDHDSQDHTVCDHCEMIHEIVVTFVCDVCKSSMRTGIWNTILTDVAVIAFFHEHGLDTKALEDDLAYGELYEAIEREAVHTETPLEIVVTVELDGDRLDVTLDDEARIIDVTERVPEAA